VTSAEARRLGARRRFVLAIFDALGVADRDFPHDDDDQARLDALLVALCTAAATAGVPPDHLLRRVARGMVDAYAAADRILARRAKPD
jgi:hypothetical protein